MKTPGLSDIVQESTSVFRKGKLVEESQVGNVTSVEQFGYKPTSEAPSGDGVEKVDMIFIDVVVTKAMAEKYKGALVKQLENYPQKERLVGGQVIEN